jgi:hypothetical protein
MLLTKSARTSVTYMHPHTMDNDDGNDAPNRQWLIFTCALNHSQNPEATSRVQWQ